VALQTTRLQDWNDRVGNPGWIDEVWDDQRMRVDHFHVENHGRQVPGDPADARVIVKDVQENPSRTLYIPPGNVDVLPAGWTRPAPGVVARDLAPGIVLRVQDDGQGGINGNGWGWQFSNPAAADPGVPSL
jgi:hypothetical protein